MYNISNFKEGHLMTIHHINKPEFHKFNNPTKYNSLIEQEIRKLDMLNVGDLVHFSNGEHVCNIVKNLSDFENYLPESGCASILKYDPRLLLCNHITLEKRKVFSARKVSDIKGNYAEQVLINYLNSPMWINISTNEYITCISDNHQMKCIG